MEDRTEHQPEEKTNHSSWSCFIGWTPLGPLHDLALLLASQLLCLCWVSSHASNQPNAIYPSEVFHYVNQNHVALWRIIESVP